MAKTTKNAKPKTERRTAKDRRNQSERRKDAAPVAEERRTGDRRKVQRRRQIDPTTCERDYSADEIEFMHALDAYKRSSGRMFPTCSEILEVIRGLGYERVVPPVVDPSAHANTSADDVLELDLDLDLDLDGATAPADGADGGASDALDTDLEESTEADKF